MRRMKRAWWFLIVPVVLLVLAGAAFLYWALTPLGPTETAMEALSEGGTVAVTETDDGWRFEPADASAETTTGLVFYGGGRVDARSYAPFARELASLGHVVVIAKAPLSLQVFDPDAATAIIESPDHDSVARWAVAGHSLGGAMAAQYVADEPAEVGGLLLLAAYPPGEPAVADTIAVTDVTGTEDGVLDQEAWGSGRSLLPDATEYVSLDGGNHAQFGDYGPQPGDNPPTMSAAEQRARSVGAAHALLQRL